MAKTKSKKTQNQTRNKPRKTRKRSTGGGNIMARRYAHLLHNPDNGDHMFDIYDGERGETQKFVSTITLNTTTGHTSGFLQVLGATGNGQSASGATSSTALTFALLNTGYPGATFLTANANKTRCKALKLELIPSAASFSTITGEVAAGVTTSASFVSGTTTVDNLFDISKAYGPLRRETVVSRWIPSGLDHTYANYNTVPNEDHNAVFIAYRGWPAGVQISVRITYVVEYTIKNLIGIPPTGAVSVPLGHQHVLAAMQQQDPHWHHSILDEVKRAGVGIAKDAGNFARHMARNGMVSLAEKFFSRAAEGAIVLA
nr:MAG: hypothetical protein [Narnaviridae sp.]